MKRIYSFFTLRRMGKFDLFLAIAMIIAISSFIVQGASALTASQLFGEYTYPGSRLTGAQSEIFPQNNLTFWNPYECEPRGGSGGRTSPGACGDNAAEIYWSVLREHFDEEHTAAIFGSIYGEGTFGVTRWEIGHAVTGDGGTFVVPWESLYNCTGGCTLAGVGSVGITWWLGEYLHYINEKAPEMLKYFQNPSEYSYEGDTLIEKIGKEEFIKLVELEIDFFTSVWDAEEFKTTSGVGEAADYWTINFENCINCCGAADADHSCEELPIRRAKAESVYEDRDSYACSGGTSSAATPSASTPSSGGSTPAPSDAGSSGGTVSGSDITWIGDSYSVQADNKGLISSKFSGVDIGPGSNNTSSSYIQGSKFVSSGSSSNPSCLDILQDIIDAGKLRKYLVFACGTNGGWSDSDVTKFQNKIKDKDVKVIVVNSRFKACYPGISCDPTFADSNSRLKAMADSNDKITLADWASVYNEDYFKTDTVHPTTDPGYEKWIGVIESALGSGGDCGGNGDVLKAVEEVIKLANANGSTYVTDGANRSQEDFDAMLSGTKAVDVDCTAFASLVMYKAFGEMALFCSGSISSVPQYEEVTPKSDAKPGDIFVYGPCGSGGHGGIVVEVKDGQVTRVAETGGSEGRSGSNNNVGYSTDNYTVQKVNSSDGHIYRWKGSGDASKKSGSCPSSEGGTPICDDGSGSGGSGGNESYNGTGLTDEQAEKLATNYNNNTDNWDSKAGANLFCEGSECASKYSNCSLMSAFFVEMFTSIGTGQSWTGMYGGNVVNVLSGMGFSTGSEPKAFSVFSCGPTNWGHTGVVVRVDGDSVTTVEAGYPNQVGQKSNMSWCSGYGPATYAYLNDKMDTQKLMDFINK